MLSSDSGMLVLNDVPVFGVIENHQVDSRLTGYEGGNYEIPKIQETQKLRSEHHVYTTYIRHMC